MKHKERVRRRFGNTDVEHVALELYRLFHGDYPYPGDGWTAYKKHRGDHVVEYFRSAAEAAIDEYAFQNPVYDQRMWDRSFGGADDAVD